MTQPNKEKVIRVYADGVFDNFHLGHSNMLKQCKEAFPGQKVYVIAGVCSQQDVESRKGPLITSQKQRYQMVRQCRYVDEVYQGCPWNLTEEFINKLNIDYVMHDEQPYKTKEGDDAYAIPKKMGKFKATKRTQGVSTTDVVGNILKNREMYIARNMNRGATAKDLGLSLPMFYYFKLKQKICPYRNPHQKKQ